ncbi:hypothetical protein K2173_019676 [Erythroxylum novogranatense]|uniref:BHLH domain-containing protein n=1 Tax=Erythroxylum novogranatense TaxID=1862640 RepID=A0AAV8SLY5_9ROSI|nr:hypothetical protein K2173_019676 [Erythroxylum novogranatense]
MSSQCMVPTWNLRQQRQKQVEEEKSNTSSHVHKLLQNPNPLVPMSDHGVAELTWENGQLAMHGFGGIPQSGLTKPSWIRIGDTLESIVHQATFHQQDTNYQDVPQAPPNVGSLVESSDGSGHLKMASLLMKKHAPPETNQYANSFSCTSRNENMDRSACASTRAPATSCMENDDATMTWASFESSRSLKTKTTEEDSACHGGSENQHEDRDTKTETVRSNSNRRVRAAAIHNQSERRRRHRINQKMKQLQKLVPNASKTDKASMLDEVIEYLKQLQAQVQIMNTARNMPHMMVPLGMQQQLHQLSVLARMGMGSSLGMGIGMLDLNTMAHNASQTLPPFMHPNHPPPPGAATTPAFVHQVPFVVPHPLLPTQGPATAAPHAIPDIDSKSLAPLTDPYSAFVAQVCDTINLKGNSGYNNHGCYNLALSF